MNDLSQIKILAFTKYSYLGPSSRYRFYNYQRQFEKNGVLLKITPLFNSSYFHASTKLKKICNVISSFLSRLFALLNLFLNSKKYSLIIIEYELFPYFPAVFERLLRLRNINYIVDYDDAIFHKYDRHKNLLARSLFKDKISKVMNNAKAVMVGNEYLQGYAKRYNNKTLLLPTVVLLEKYEKQHQNQQLSKSKKHFIIGWIGSKTTSPYLLDILPAIEKFVTSANAQCHFIGFDEELLSYEEIKKCKIQIIPWSEETEIKEIYKFDVGIMPLKEDAWSKGKCGFKLIQYMSCRKPVIASPVGVNKKIVEPDINGFLASSDSQWGEALKKLYKDEKLRFKMAENNWKKINSQFNHSKNCEKYLELINKIVKQF